MSPRTPSRARDGAQDAAPAPVAVSEELFAPISAEIELCYQTFGDPDDEPLLLVMGLGGPMIWWNPELCEQLARAGFYVIRYDNRDTGRSSRVRGRVTRQMLVRAFLGRPVRTPYALTDLAADGFALLDHLGLGSAHLTGVSMGGMIVQTMALTHPERVRSLVSIMSTTGRRSVGRVDPTLMPRLLASGNRDRDTYITQSRVTWEAIGSPDYPEEPERTSDRAAATYDRGVSSSGVLRQMLAILTQPNRTRALQGLSMPALVLHGLSDRMVHVSGGRATARAIPGAELVLVSGMGHDMPHALFDTFVGAIRRTADRAAR